MNPGVLRGREHTNLGVVAVIAEGRCGIALSRGGAAKTYHYADPNEDAAAFVAGDGGILLAVADGHGGCNAAEVAIDRLLERNAHHWTDAATPGLGAIWPATARAAIQDVNVAIVRSSTQIAGDSSRTTLAFALLRPADDLFAFASMGDSHAFRVADGAAEDLAKDPGTRTAFLGFAQETAESLRTKCVVGIAGLHGACAAVLVTDGLSEHGIGVEAPAAAVVEATERARQAAPEPCALTTARSLAETALAAHRRNQAGDNVACAVAWFEEEPGARL